MALTTRLTARLGLTHPILSAPMAFAGGGKLAAAVSAAGGLGLIGGGYGDSDWLAREFDAAGNQTVGAGFITWSMAKTPALLDLVLERAPRAVMLSFGDPAPFAGKIRAAGAALICQVQTLEHARAALGAGAEIVVAQGAEAGGHGASRGTLAIVPEVADLVAGRAPETLVLAAGGIADGRGLAAALMLGADGVLMGSRFWASREALVPERFHARALESDGDGTTRSTVMDIARKLDWPEGFTARVLNTAFLKRWHGDEAGLRAEIDRVGPDYAAAWTEGDPDRCCVFVGEAAGLIRDIPAAGGIVERISAEAERLLAGAGKFTM